MMSNYFQKPLPEAKDTAQWAGESTVQTWRTEFESLTCMHIRHGCDACNPLSGAETSALWSPLVWQPRWKVRLLAQWEKLSQGSKTVSHRRYQMSSSSFYIPDHLCACPTYTYIQHVSHIHAYIQHIAHTSTCTHMYIQHITHKHTYKCMHEHTETYITHLTCSHIHNTSCTLTCTHTIITHKYT